MTFKLTKTYKWIVNVEPVKSYISFSQLGELVMVENYPEAIQLIAKFTVQSLQMWQFAPNSVHYLLSLWQRMVASVPYVKATEPHLLETYTPEVSNAYITSRLESVAVVVREGLEDPLDDLGMVQQQLEQLSVIGRCEYQKTCTLLVQLFDQAARLYQELMSQSVTPTQQMDILIQEGQLTWLVYIIGENGEEIQGFANTWVYGLGGTSDRVELCRARKPNLQSKVCLS